MSHPNPPKPPRRRRKKRRTEDFSSSSDSSDSEHEAVQIEEKIEPISIDDIEMESEPETSLPAPLTDEQRKKLNQVHLTKTQLSSVTSMGKGATRGIDTSEVGAILEQDKSKLSAQYLAYMAKEFGDDLDELRKKPDFTDKSLVILAKTLQSGVAMFDPDTLGGLLNDREQ